MLIAVKLLASIYVFCAFLFGNLLSCSIEYGKEKGGISDAQCEHSWDCVSLEQKPSNTDRNKKKLIPRIFDGWIVIQRRLNGSVNFYRDYDSYEHGFGDSSGEYFIGLKALHNLTNKMPMEFFIEIEDFANRTYLIFYDKLVIGPQQLGYKIEELGQFSGNAWDSLRKHVNLPFSTFDNDNDITHKKNCAENFKGGWWYNSCQQSNLNGPYLDSPYFSKGVGVTWNGITTGKPLKYVAMMIRAIEEE